MHLYVDGILSMVVGGCKSLYRQLGLFVSENVGSDVLYQEFLYAFQSGTSSTRTGWFPVECVQV